jgi:hypothetical protein
MADIIKPDPDKITVIPPESGTMRLFLGDALSSWVEKVGIVLTILPFIENIPAVSEWLHNKPFLEGHLWFLWLIGGFCIFWGFYEAYKKQYEARLKAEQVPTELKLQILDFHHRPQTGDNQDKSLHIFVKASIELFKPKTAEVTYEFSLIFPNATARQRSINDVELWGMRVLEPDPSRVVTAYLSIDELPTRLICGEKREGWLHFKFIPHGMDALRTAQIRLTAQTPHGGVSDEHSADDVRWPLIGRNVSIIKMRTEEWFNLPEDVRRFRLGRFGEYDSKL